MRGRSVPPASHLQRRDIQYEQIDLAGKPGIHGRRPPAASVDRRDRTAKRLGCLALRREAAPGNLASDTHRLLAQST